MAETLIESEDSVFLLWILAGTAAILLGAVVSVLYSRGMLAKRQRETRHAEDLFEKTVLRSIERETRAAKPPTGGPDAAGAEDGSQIGSSPPGDRIEEVIRKLQIAGLLDMREGPLVWEIGQPPAQLLRLSNGKSAAVFPPGTPLERFAAHSRTIDFLLTIQEDGSVLCCRSFSDFIADSVFDR